jgi:hypothetical protein
MHEHGADRLRDPDGRLVNGTAARGGRGLPPRLRLRHLPSRSRRVRPRAYGRAAIGASEEGWTDDPQHRMEIKNRIRAIVPPGSVPIRLQRRNERVRALTCGALAAAILAAVLLAGCGGSGSSSGGAHVNSYLTSALAYSRCMRSHGVPDFPDPDGQGEFQLQAVQVHNGVKTVMRDQFPSSPAFQAAQRVCGSFGSAGRQVTAAQEEQEFQKSLKAAACMRANGVPNYPDPTLIDGTIDHNFNSGLKINPSSPAFQQAEQKCGHGQPGLVGPG